MIQPKRNHKKIWSKIHPDWDYDLHIHTNWIFHRLDTSDEIPVKSDLLKILTHFDTWKQFLDKYFEYQQIMVETYLFDGIAHPKVIFRDFTTQEIPNRIFLYAQEKLKILAKSCSDRGILIEANLSGFRKTWKESFPSSKMIKHLIAENFPLYIGFDCHTPQQFERMINEIRRYKYILLEKL